MDSMNWCSICGQRGTEVWKDIKGYEGLYKISSCGRVRSLPRNGTISKEKIIKNFEDRYGYLYVSLNKANAKKKEKVHRLVAAAFIDNLNLYEQVNHIDENKKNNHVKNLEWCTAKYNQNYSNYKIYKKVRCLNTNIVYKSITEASKQLNVDNSGITKVCKGKIKKIKGLEFEYVR